MLSSAKSDKHLRWMVVFTGFYHKYPGMSSNTTKTTEEICNLWCEVGPAPTGLSRCLKDWENKDVLKLETPLEPQETLVIFP